jgi:hypothetical protein
VRYVDDFILVHQSAEQLRCWQQSIEAFLQQQLQLKLKPQIILRPLNAGADFLGYIVRPHYRLVRRRVLANWRNKLKQWRARVANGHGLYQLPPTGVCTFAVTVCQLLRTYSPCQLLYIAE